VSLAVLLSSEIQPLSDGGTLIGSRLMRAPPVFVVELNRYRMIQLAFQRAMVQGRGTGLSSEPLGRGLRSAGCGPRGSCARPRSTLRRPRCMCCEGPQGGSLQGFCLFLSRSAEDSQRPRKLLGDVREALPLGPAPRRRTCWVTSGRLSIGILACWCRDGDPPL
jgi:hypothetical protein